MKRRDAQMGKNVLLVDDSSTARKIVRIYLKEKGFNIIEAENGLDALEKMAYSDIDVVITDLNMPMMNGMELISTLKRDVSSRDIPIIIITTEKEEDEKRVNPTDTNQPAVALVNRSHRQLPDTGPHGNVFLGVRHSH